MVGSNSLSTHRLILKPSTTTIKFLCSYGGKILPRYPDGKLRYHGGETRVLAVERSIPFAELLVKLGELCGTSVRLRCQLPTEDLDALVSITSDEDLANLIEEYDRATSPPPFSLKIRAFLSSLKSPKKISPPPSTIASSSSSSLDHPASPKPPYNYSLIAAPCGCGGSSTSRFPVAAHRSIHKNQKPIVFPICYEKSAEKLPQYGYHGHGNTGCIFMIQNGNHWQSHQMLEDWAGTKFT